MADRETEQWIVNELRSIQSNMTRKEYNKMIERFVTAHRDNALQYLLDPAHPERAIFLDEKAMPRKPFSFRGMGKGLVVCLYLCYDCIG